MLITSGGLTVVFNVNAAYLYKVTEIGDRTAAYLYKVFFSLFFERIFSIIKDVFVALKGSRYIVDKKSNLLSAFLAVDRRRSAFYLLRFTITSATRHFISAFNAKKGNG